MSTNTPQNPIEGGTHDRKGILYVIATPIGNLEDITLRALRVLGEVDLIAAEDTRQTRKLLTRYDIRTPMTSYHGHNERTKAGRLLQSLRSGAKIGLVSDAGTPTLSDPGAQLVRLCVQEGVSVVPVPGPSAFTAALSASGFPADRFVFRGFPPVKRSQRLLFLEGLRAETETLVFYEAPHRIQFLLADCLEVLGNRDVVLARELTKLHEEFMRGSITELIDRTRETEPRGELVLLVHGATEESTPSTEELFVYIRRLGTEGLRVNEIAKLVSETFSVPKREAYALVLQSKRKSGE